MGLRKHTIFTSSENLFSKLFPATFTGKAVTRFTDLKPQSIESWVSQMFVDRIRHTHDENIAYSLLVSTKGRRVALGFLIKVLRRNCKHSKGK